MTSKLVRFYFDPISPYAWLAWNPIRDICRTACATLVPTPVLFAGLLNKHGQLGPAEIPPKRVYIMKDVARRAHARNLSVNPPPSHPFNPLLALRTLTLVMEDATLSNDVKFSFVSGILDACWSYGKDISSRDVVRAVAADAGLNGAALTEAAQTNQTVKDRLRLNTEDAIACGVFGVPTCIIDGDIYWGSETDTIDHIRRAVIGAPIPIDEKVLNKWVTIKPSASRR